MEEPAWVQRMRASYLRYKQDNSFPEIPENYLRAIEKILDDFSRRSLVYGSLPEELAFLPPEALAHFVDNGEKDLEKRV